MKLNISVSIYVGKNAEQFIDILSKMRIEAFKEFPYLYQGNVEIEREYLKGYASNMQGIIAVATMSNKILGIATGIPVVSDTEITKSIKINFKNNQLNPKDYYYYGEVIILPSYRQQGIAKALFAAQEEKISEWGYKNVCILTVIREEQHPQKPKDYSSSDIVWEKLGFFKMPIIEKNRWPTIKFDQSIEDCEHIMQYWEKKL